MIELVRNSEEAFQILRDLEIELTPTLSDRGINISNYSEKVFTNGYILKMVYENFVVGAICYYIDKEKNQTFVSFLAIADEFKGRQFGSRLIEECIKHSRRESIDSIRLETRKSNVNAILFYKKLGFIDLKDSFDSIYLIKNL